jgi:hypothetical protein
MLASTVTARGRILVEVADRGRPERERQLDGVERHRAAGPADDEDLAALRLERTEAFLARNARAISRLQRAGLADPSLDPDLASLALSTMVSRSAYVTFAVGRPSASAGQLAATLTRLWVNALGIPAGQRTGTEHGKPGKAGTGSEQ